MAGMRRRMPGLFGKVLFGVSYTAEALAGTVLDADLIAPVLVANNAPDPQMKLVGVIGILLAGSLSLMVAGYVFESSRFGVKPPDSAASAQR